MLIAAGAIVGVYAVRAAGHAWFGRAARQEARSALGSTTEPDIRKALERTTYFAKPHDGKGISVTWQMGGVRKNLVMDTDAVVPPQTEGLLLRNDPALDAALDAAKDGDTVAVPAASIVPLKDAALAGVRWAATVPFFHPPGCVHTSAAVGALVYLALRLAKK